MNYSISRVAVIGAGTMGAGIAVHLANAGVEVDLLDILPTKLTPAEEAKGFTPQDDVVRNRLAREGLARAGGAKYSGFFTPACAKRVRIGNLEDHLDRSAAADWVIEAVVEDLSTKQALMTRIEPFWRPGMIVTTNTSGLHIADIAQERSEKFKTHFLGTHFFNPPRVMHLLEVIPGPMTDPEIVRFIVAFCEERLGKGVVLCRDTPNFIANRIAAIQRSFDWEYLLTQEYTVEEGDAILSSVIGRPRTGHFRLADLVGLDVSAKVAANLYDLIPEDAYRDLLIAPRSSALREQMIDEGLLGKKSGKGFYKAVEGEGGTAYWTLDLETLTYHEPQKVDLSRLREAMGIQDLAVRIHFLISESDRPGSLVWASVSNTLAYASTCVPDVSPDLLSVDRAMRWGYAWDLGPFELWDALGVESTLDRISENNKPVGGWVREMLDLGIKSFYAREGIERLQYDPEKKGYVPVAEDPRRIDLPAVSSELNLRFDGGRLMDLGDGVALLDLNLDIFLDEAESEPLQDALAGCLESDFRGLLIRPGIRTNLEKLVELVDKGRFDRLERSLQLWDGWRQRIRSFQRPVVALCEGDCIGIRTEWALMAHRICAAAETQFGFDHVKWGLLPFMGGSVDLLRRFSSVLHYAPSLDSLPLLRQAFDLILSGRRLQSADEAFEAGLLREADQIVMNPDFLLAQGKAMVLSLTNSGYRAVPSGNEVFVLGERGAAALDVTLFLLEQAGRIGSLEKTIGKHLARVLSGGGLTSPQWVSEGFMLELERDAVLSLLGEERFLARMRSQLHM